MKKTLLTGIAALFLATGTAQAMEHDLSNTWCAKHIPTSAYRGRETYYRWIEKCHRRRGTKPHFATPCFPDTKPEDATSCEIAPVWFYRESK